MKKFIISNLLICSLMFALVGCGKASVGDDTVDVDLTKLSSTMVYSEVYQMVTEPDSYKGKVVKMKGVTSIFENPKLHRVYYACIIADATACCSQGIEFRLKNNKPLPTTYKNGDELTVVGTFSTYLEDGIMYCELVDSQII